jgi:hypothetical protein
MAARLRQAFITIPIATLKNGQVTSMLYFLAFLYILVIYFNKNEARHQKI